MGLVTEKHIFLQELKQLYRDYKRCKDEALREEIQKDIVLLKKAIALLI